MQIFRDHPSPMALFEPRPPFRILDATDSYIAMTHKHRETLIGHALFEAFPPNPDDSASAESFQRISSSLERALATKHKDDIGLLHYDIRRPPDLGGGFEERHWFPMTLPILSTLGEVKVLLHRVFDVTDVVAQQSFEHGDSRAELNKKIVELNADVASRSKALSEALTSLREVNQQLEISMKETQRASRAKTEFLANISHEMRTPLNAIIGFSQLLERSMQTNPETVEYVQSIAAAGKHLLDLINDLLDLAKIGAGKLRLSPVPLNVRNLLAEVASMFAPKCMEKGLKLCVELSPDLPQAVIADPLRLRQVVMNLLSNAIKFTVKGEVRLSAEVTSPPPSTDLVNLSITVSDTGIGIPSEHLPHLFRKFEQIGTRSTTGHDGTGLGLPITRELARLMGGDVEVQSTLNKGSDFTVHISLATADAGELHTEAAGAAYRVAKEHSDTPILVVDDVDYNRSVLIAFLRTLGFNHFKQASSGDTAIAEARLLRYPLVFMDLLMPNLDGIGAARILRSLDDKAAEGALVIIAVTASMATDSLSQAEQSGLFDSFVIKPIELDKLKNAIESATHFKFIEEGTTAEHRRVLVVDDQSMMRRLICITLRAGDLIEKVDAVSGGEQALNRLREERYNIVLLDRIMPIMDGLETVRRIKVDILHPPPVILMSADFCEAEVKECLAAGADGILEKPIKLDEFNRLTAKLLGCDAPTSTPRRDLSSSGESDVDSVLHP